MSSIRFQFVLLLCWLPFFGYGQSLDKSQSPTFHLVESCEQSASADFDFSRKIAKLKLEGASSANKYLNSPVLQDKIDALSAALYDKPINMLIRSRTTVTESVLPTNATLEQITQITDATLAKIKFVTDGFIDPVESIRGAARDTNFRYSRSSIDKTLQNIRQSSGRPHIQSVLAQQMTPYSCHFAFSASESNRHQKIQQCQAASKDIMALMDPKQISEVSVSFLPLLTEVLTEPIYRVGLSRLALKMLNKVEAVKNNKDKSKILDLGNFAEDIQEVFTSLGLSPEQVDEKAVHLQALYGARGAGFGFLYELITQQTIPLYFSLTAITTAIGVLERATVTAPQSYPYILGMSTNCEYGRPYHFWMGYSLAKQLLKKGHSKLAIFSAIHTLGTAYEMFADDGSNAGELVLIPGNDWYKVETQKDIVFKSYGAWLALAGSSPTQQPLDDELTRVMANNSDVDVTAFQEVPFLVRNMMKLKLSDPEMWIKKVAPNASFDRLKQSFP